MTAHATEEIPLSIRMARRADAGSIARIHVESWRETYANILPVNGLTGMSQRRETASWAATIMQQSMRNPVLVAADAQDGIYGFLSAGPSRDKTLPFEAEVYTLYVAPGHTGQGIGFALLDWCFGLFRRAGFRSAIIWALASNPSRFFYERQGGTLVAERDICVFGAAQREIGYGWRNMKPYFERTA
jgi:GNAT superfamily N-acetyltransferase